MRLEGQRESENVEDRRGMRGAPVAFGGLGMILLIIIVKLMGGNPAPLLQKMQQNQQQQAQGQRGPQKGSPEEEALASFVKKVLGNTEDVWDRLFRERGERYQRPTLVMFTDSVSSACGHASAAMGPFYCPGDSKVYIDLAFYDDLKHKLGAPGDAAQAYVIAHEVGHHIQNLLGISDKVHELRGRVSEEEYNRASVRLELQADYLAGVWAHHGQREKRIFEEEDFDEIFNAAEMIGDDTLQKRAQGRVVPDAFTHGTAKQRKRWFMRGLKSGRMEEGDTFKVDYEDL